MITSEWFGAYADSWQGEITDESFCHPAKYSRGLIARIYDHMLSMGYIEPGNIIGDPFGGVALGAIHAMLKGMDWRGVELEPKFVELGNQNIDLWRGKYGDLLRGTAVLVQGDSREFLRHVTGLDMVLASPPYATSITDDRREGGGIDLEKSKHERSKLGKNGQGKVAQTYGQTPGQLGAMKEGSLDAIVTSPVYADVVDGSGEGPGARFDHVHHNGENATKKSSDNEYGRTAGNLGGLDAVVSSAPFEDNNVNIGAVGDTPSKRQQIHNSEKREQSYGSTSGNIGNDSADTFWAAAKTIVAQTYAALKPGAYAAWVCGDYVRQGERVYFGRQWLELCQSVGYEPVEWIVAWKREHRVSNIDLFGNRHESLVDRVSFFRRLANNKSHASEHWKTIDSTTRDEWVQSLSDELWAEYAAIMETKEPEQPQSLTIETARQYEIDLRNYQILSKQKKNIKKPTDSKILGYAKMAAWIENESPSLSDAAILNEDVIIVRKPIS